MVRLLGACEYGVVQPPHVVVQLTLIRDFWTTNIYAMKSSVELGDSPAPCANGASLEPMTFKHILFN